VTRLYRPTDAAPVPVTTRASIDDLSELNNMAWRLAVYASKRAVTRPRRKTRFQVLARLSWAGSTRRVLQRGFSYASASHDFLLSRASLGAIPDVP
jgi:hypothetical protein